jgi:hypothetical protein
MVHEDQMVALFTSVLQIGAVVNRRRLRVDVAASIIFPHKRSFYLNFHKADGLS